MVAHYWGDKWFKKHGDELYEAMSYIDKFYRRATESNGVCFKEKYGTVRYEMEWSWLKDEKDSYIFFEILRRATVKFHNVAAELVFDLDICALDNPLVSYYKGYFDGIAWGQRKSRWVKYGKKWSNPIK